MLMESSEPKLAEFNRKLTPGKENILGVRIPVIRSIAKKMVKDDWRGFLDSEPEYLEEEILMGLVIATASMDVQERIALTEDFLDYVDNWATCDTFCSSWRFEQKDSDIVWDYFSGLIETDDEFRMRVSTVARMSLFKDEGHYRALIEDLRTHDNEGYYYRMGSAWAISTVYVECPEMVMELLESGDLEPWTHNKSIQKICESLRVSDDDRLKVKALKRRAP